MYKWIISEKLAVSPMPTFEEIRELSNIFDGVVVLIEPHEYPGGDIRNYINLWKDVGVEVYYSPTRDFWFPPILELYHITKWIHEKIKEGGRVLVHCMGGIGRSGTVAASYIIYSSDMVPWNAVSHVRKHIPGALEVPRQEKIVYDYYYMLKYISDRKLLETIDREAAKRNYGAGIRHVSKVTQLSTEILTDISLFKNIDDYIKKAVVIASILHDMGYSSGEHGEKSVEIASKILGMTDLDDKIIDLILTIIRCHHINWCKEIKYDLPLGILWIADYLDHGFDNTVDYIEVDVEDSELVLKIHCGIECSHNIDELRKILSSIEEILGKKIIIKRYYE